jgi:hypothetical protein
VHNLRTRRLTCIFAGFVLLGSVLSTAKGDSITPSYTITDLGSGSVALTTGTGTSIPINSAGVYYDEDLGSEVSSAANGAQITSVSVGQTSYPFVFTPPTVLTANQGIMTNFPLAMAAPVGDPNTYGNPINAYSVVSSPLMNANGIVVAIDSAGVSGHEGTPTVYFAQRIPDGSWGSPTVAWYGVQQSAQGPGLGGITLAGINNLGQIIGTMSYNPNQPSVTNAVVYDIGTHTLTNLSSLPELASFTNVVPIAIDDSGRILVEASPVELLSNLQGEQTLLLTPAGEPGNPVPAPEPSSFAVMVLAMGAFAVCCVRDRIRRRDDER